MLNILFTGMGSLMFIGASVFDLVSFGALSWGTIEEIMHH